MFNAHKLDLFLLSRMEYRIYRKITTVKPVFKGHLYIPNHCSLECPLYTGLTVIFSLERG